MPIAHDDGLGSLSSMLTFEAATLPAAQFILPTAMLVYSGLRKRIHSALDQRVRAELRRILPPGRRTPLDAAEVHEMIHHFKALGGAFDSTSLTTMLFVRGLVLYDEWLVARIARSGGKATGQSPQMAPLLSVRVTDKHEHRTTAVAVFTDSPYLEHLRYYSRRPVESERISGSQLFMEDGVFDMHDERESLAINPTDSSSSLVISRELLPMLISWAGTIALESTLRRIEAAHTAQPRIFFDGFHAHHPDITALARAFNFSPHPIWVLLDQGKQLVAAANGCIVMFTGKDHIIELQSVLSSNTLLWNQQMPVRDLIDLVVSLPPTKFAGLICNPSLADLSSAKPSLSSDQIHDLWMLANK